MEAGIANIEPNITVTAAPVVLLIVTSRYRSSAASPSPAPVTTPVTRSRSLARSTRNSSMQPAAMTPMPRKPSSGLMPSRNAAAPPALLTSAREWPAKDCPRITVKTPTAPETTAAAPPTSAAVCTGWLVKNPGSTINDSSVVMAFTEFD